MDSMKQTDKKYLIFESQFEEDRNHVRPGYINNRWFWSDRLVFISDMEKDYNNKEDYWNFTALNLLMNESKPIRFKRFGRFFVLYNVTPLNDEIGFIVEKTTYSFCINLVKIDWNKNEFQLLERFEKESPVFKIMTDSLNPSKFALYWTEPDRMQHFQICKLLKGEKIEFGEIHQFRDFFDFYSRDKFIGSYIGYKSSDITIYDLVLKKEQTFKIDLSEVEKSVILHNYREYFDGNVYYGVYLGRTKNYGIIWADLMTKKWKLLDFKTDSRIEQLKVFNGNFIVDTKEGNKNFKIRDIPIKHPNHLRYSAWLCVVKIMKNKGKGDPYEAAKEFLPLNSDLREVWFKNEEKTEISNN